MCPIKSTNYKPELKVTPNAYDATNNANTVTSSEYFDFNEVGVYDTQTNTWLDLTEEQLNDPEVIKQYSDDSRYAMALGSDMNNIDGFMNMSDYIDESGITFDETDSAQVQRDAHDYETGGSTIKNGLSSEAAHDEHVSQLHTQASQRNSDSEAAKIQNRLESYKTKTDASSLNYKAAHDDHTSQLHTQASQRKLNSEAAKIQKQLDNYKTPTDASSLNYKAAHDDHTSQLHTQASQRKLNSEAAKIQKQLDNYKTPTDASSLNYKAAHDDHTSQLHTQASQRKLNSEAAKIQKQLDNYKK